MEPGGSAELAKQVLLAFGLILLTGTLSGFLAQKLKVPDVVVFLLAGAVGREVCEQAGALALTTNLSGHSNVLQLCLRSGSRCVFFSSSEIYGPHDEVLDEVFGS